MPPDVTLVGTYPPAGRRHAGFSGVASYTANLAHALSAAGRVVQVIAAREPGQPDRHVDGPVLVERRYTRGPRALPSAVAAAAQTGAPVVHIQHEFFLYGGLLSIPGLVAARSRRGRSTVVTMHQVVDPVQVDAEFVALHRVRAPVPGVRLGLSAMQRAVRTVADAVIVHEPRFAELVPGAHVIPHGVEEQVRPERDHARRALGLDERLTVLCFGFVAPYKGLEAALAGAALAGPEVQLVVAGGEHPRLAGRDPYAADLRMRWGTAARFVGRVEEADVARWFAAADVALFAYPQPFSSSGALALALAHGTPCLVSPEMGQCAGLPAELHVAREPGSIAKRLQLLAGRRELLTRLREVTTSVGGSRHWSTVADRHLELYEEVSSGKRLARGRVRTTESGRRGHSVGVSSSAS